MVELLPDPPAMIRDLEPRFRLALRGIAPRPPAGPAAGEEWDRLAGPIFHLASDLILGRLRAEARDLLDAAAAAHPWGDHSALQIFLDALRPDPGAPPTPGRPTADGPGSPTLHRRMPCNS